MLSFELKSELCIQALALSNVLVFWAQDCLDALPVFQCSVDRVQEQGNLVCALANQSKEREGKEARRALV